MDAVSSSPTIWMPTYSTVAIDFEESQEGLSATTIIVTLLLLFGLVAHIFAMLATRKADQYWREEYRRSVPYFLLNVLLKIDFFAVIFFLLRGFASPWFVSNLIFRCEFSLSTNILITWMSGFANVTMCLERCFALIAPYNYRKHVTIFRAKVILIILMAAAFAAAFMPIFGFGSYRVRVENGGYDCLSPGDPHVTGVNFVLEYTVIFFVVGFSTVIVICASNLVVVCVILRLKVKISPTVPQCEPSILTLDKARSPDSSAGPRRTNSAEQTALGSAGKKLQTDQQPNQRSSNCSTQNRKEIKLALMFLLVSMVYTVSWLPLYLNRFMIALQLPTLDIAFSLSICLLTLNHVVDPVIFVLLKEKNRLALQLVMAQCCCCSCSEVPSRNAEPEFVEAAQSARSTWATRGHHLHGSVEEQGVS